MKLLLDLSHDYLKCGANEVKTEVLWKAWEWGKETNFHFAALLSERRGKAATLLLFLNWESRSL